MGRLAGGSESVRSFDPGRTSLNVSNHPALVAGVVGKKRAVTVSEKREALDSTRSVGTRESFAPNRQLLCCCQPE